MAIHKVMFTADWHLGKRLYNIEQTEKQFYAIANKVIDMAKRLGVETIYNAGDILDSPKPTEETMHQLSLINSKLMAYGIAMYVISGNHDHTGARHWVNLFEAPDSIGGLKQDSTLGYVFHKDAVLSKLNEPELQPMPIIMLHTPVSDFNKLNFDKYVTIQQLVETDFIQKHKCKVVVIGDTHKTEIVSANDTIFLSPGSIEMVYANESIRKYVFIGEYDDETQNVLNIQQVEIPCDHIRLQSNGTIKTTADLDAFINKEIYGTYNKDQWFNSAVAIYISCSSEMKNEITGRLKDIIFKFGNNSDETLTTLRDFETYPGFVHLAVASRKFKTEDTLVSKDETDKEDEEVIMSFTSYRDEDLSLVKLSNEALELLRVGLTANVDNSTLTSAFENYINKNKGKDELNKYG